MLLRFRLNSSPNSSGPNCRIGLHWSMPVRLGSKEHGWDGKKKKKKRKKVAAYVGLYSLSAFWGKIFYLQEKKKKYSSLCCAFIMGHRFFKYLNSLSCFLLFFSFPVTKMIVRHMYIPLHVCF